MRNAIEGATTVAEIRRLTRMLASGFVYVLSPHPPSLIHSLTIWNRPTEKDLDDLKKGTAA